MGLIQEFQKADAERRREVKQLQHEVASMRADVATVLKDLAQGDKERAAKVSDYLHTGVGKIRSEVATMFQDLAQEATERATEIAHIRSEVTAIHEMVWGKTPAVRATAPLAKDLPRTATVEAPPDSELHHKVLTYLTHHPDGSRLTELEEAFGMARIQTARVLRELIDDSKVVKRDLLYFSI